jgi:hypothetical protein
LAQRNETVNLPIDWLLEGDPWVVYRTRRDLLGESEEAPAVAAARREMLASPLVKGLLAELAGWPGQPLASHKSASQLFHKLTLAADLGLKASDPGVGAQAASGKGAVVERILAHQSEEGPFQLPTNISAAHGGSGQEQWAWALCDAPLVVYGLVKLGLGSQPQVQTAIQSLAGLVHANGWPCAVSQELGKWRGPGRKDDPCPFATLAMLKLLAALDAPEYQAAAQIGAETLLSLWQDSLERHPYIFYMGTDFRKLKAPFVWYDLLHVLEVLSQCEWLRGDQKTVACDPRLGEMLALLKSKADAQGRFTPESVWTVWKDYDFGQKKAPSRWLTLLAWRIIMRMDSVSE